MGLFSNKIENTLLSELDRVSKKYSGYFSFDIIKELLIEQIKKNSKKIMEFIDSFNGERSIEEWIHSSVGNIIGHYLESGRYHVYRGVLDMTGKDLLEVYDKSLDFLLEIKAKDINVEYVEENKKVLRYNIKQMG